MSSLLILGASGHGKSVLDCALSTRAFTDIAFAVDYGCTGIHGYPVVGTLGDLARLREMYDCAVVAIGDNDFRLRMTKKLSELGYRLPPLIHRTAYVSPFAQIGPGSVVLANSSVNTDAQLGMACIVTTNASVDHDCTVGDGVHLSPTSVLCGTVHVGERSWICAGATVIDHITIGSEVIVGAGAVVLRDLPDNSKVYGVPARIPQTNR